MKTALVAGATGMTGNELVKQLLADPFYDKVFLLGRKQVQLKDPKAEMLLTNFEDLSDHQLIISEVNHLYCCLGTTMKKAGSREAFRKVDYTFPLMLARICENTAVSHFLAISAQGANPASAVFYNRIKGETERDISEAQIPAITFFRPSLLIGEREERRAAEKAAIVVAKLLSLAMAGPLKNYKAIKAGDVAAAMIREAKDQQRKGFKIVRSGEMQGACKRLETSHQSF